MPAPAFDDLVADYLTEGYEESPVLATYHGVEGYDERTPDLSADAHRRRDQRDDHWRATFAGLPDRDLTPDEEIDRDLVLSTLAGRAAMRDWEEWRRTPDAYLNAGLMGVFSLFSRRLRPEAELAQAASARLRAVPDTLEQARANLDADLASPLLVRRGVGQCRAAVVYARQLVPGEVQDPDARNAVAEAGEVAARAYEAFASHLEELAERAHGEFAIGDERYSALLRDKELLGYGAEELRKRGEAAYADLDGEMRTLARALKGHDDWRSAIDELNEDHPATPDEMREGYEQWTARARQFLVDHALVTLPDGERCEVVPSPSFQRPVLAVASYFPPPAFRPSLVGQFFVPYPPDGTSDEELAARLRNNSYPAMPTISVHEAYPGHHWHFTVLHDARPLRRVHTSSYFVEGWGLYVEKMMREQGFFTPEQELCHLDFRIFRAARIIVDTSLHLGDMTVEEAVTFMSTKASLSEPNARAEVARYCAWPTQAASYLTGSLEIERMRDAVVGSDEHDLRSFHDRLAASGGLPIALAERALGAA